MRCSTNSEQHAVRPVLVEGDTCWRRVRANRAAVLIDGAAYFGALRSSLLAAERSVFILGWELNSRMRLKGLCEPDDDAPQALGRLLRWLARRRPELEIRVLMWDYSLLYAFQRELFPRLMFGWKKPQRIEVLLDDRLPLGACHHEKLVVVDDAVAYCGGLDLTLRRWDAPEHRIADPRRRDPWSKPYPPTHDVQMVVDGEAALALGAYARVRWVRAGGEPLPAPVEASRDAWPLHVRPELERPVVGIVRTIGAPSPRDEVREIERSTMRAVERALRLIYIENQYVTAKAIADALLARMRGNPALEVLIVTNHYQHAWIETQTMGAGRERFMAAFEQAGLADRILFRYPVVAGARAAAAVPSASAGPEGEGDVPIEVHAKVLVVDDAFLRVGSANLNNRSMGLDTECDVAIEAECAGHKSAIAEVRNRLIAEHYGCDPGAVGLALAGDVPLAAALDRLGRGPRLLRPLPRDVDTDLPEVLAELGDPARVITPRRFVDDVLGLKRRRYEIRWVARLTVGVALLVLLASLWNASPLAETFSLGRIDAELDTMRGSPWRIPLVLMVFVVGSLVAVPITALIVATAIALGPEEGFVWSSVGTLLGAAAGYSVGLAVGRGTLGRMLGKTWGRVDKYLTERGVVTVALLRTIPIAPFTVVNMIMGASSVGFRDYMAGTAIAMIPGIAAVALLGDRIADLWNDPNPVNVTLALAAAALWVVAVLGIQHLVNRIRRR